MSTQKPPKFNRVIFVDRSLDSQRLVAILERMGFELARHKKYFEHDLPDDEWIPEVTARGWIILSADKRLRTEPRNAAAISQSKSRVIVVTEGNCRPEQWAASIIVGRDAISRLIDSEPGPLFASVGRSASDHVRQAKFEHPVAGARTSTGGSGA